MFLTGNFHFQVEISDLEPDTLEQLLKFIYTDKIDESSLTTLACGLLTAADKYNVQRLKVKCEGVICDNLDVSNAAQALVLGHLHEAKTLKRVALDYVTQNIAKVAESAGWSQITTGSELLGEILKTVMQKSKS